MGPAVGPREGGSFKVKNDYGAINLAVNGLVDEEWLPLYVDPTPMVIGTETFTPRVSILVWFDRALQTSTMFSEAVSTSIEVCFNPLRGPGVTFILRVSQVDYTGTTSQTLSYVSGGSGPGSGIWVMGDATTGLRFTPGKVYHPRSRKFEDLPFAKDKRFIQGLIDKYFSTPIGKQNAAAITGYIVQAVMTFAANVVLTQVAQFINANLPRSIRVEFVYGEATLTVKIGWSVLGTEKYLIRGENEVEQLEGLFNNVINMYAPGYRTLDYTILHTSSGSNSTPGSGSGSGTCSPRSDTGISYGECTPLWNVLLLLR